MRTKRKIPIHQIVYYFFLALAAIVIFIPFIWMLSASFDKVNNYALPYPPRFFPKNPSLFNFELVFKNLNIGRYMINTVLATTLALVLQLILAPLAGFAFSKGKFPLKAVILSLIMTSMMVPMEAKILPTYSMVKNMGLSNTYLGIVLPAIMTNGYFIFLMKQFCDDLPDALLESATIDGASKLVIFIRIYLPLMKPGLATLAVLDVMNTWNDLLWPMVVTNDIKMSTIQVGLAMFSTGSDSVSRHAGMATAASVISIIPLTLVFIFLQKYIVQSIAVSGIKQ